MPHPHRNNLQSCKDADEIPRRQGSLTLIYSIMWLTWNVLCILYLSFSGTAAVPTSTVQKEGRGTACLGEAVSFTCTVQQAALIQWSIEPSTVVTESDPIRFSSADPVGRTVERGGFEATLTSVVPDPTVAGTAEMTCTLTFEASEEVVVVCSAVAGITSSTSSVALLIPGISYRPLVIYMLHSD